ncbi:immunoglobulin-like domain-containing protein [Listeria seeligeri]|uniref:leucine-rich repeat domain-containing protein n=1 Tax=Listeria seeligeri TaxID=1640 RepID=UPI0022EAF8A3|nr:immunoglobulin-like domain-containing protein [Listeria seeligeri]
MFLKKKKIISASLVVVLMTTFTIPTFAEETDVISESETTTAETTAEEKTATPNSNDTTAETNSTIPEIPEAAVAPELETKSIKSTETAPEEKAATPNSKNITTEPTDIVDVSLFENQQWLIKFTEKATGKTIANTTYEDIAAIKTMQVNDISSLSAFIPKAIGLYTGLESLEICYKRNLSGTIPDEIGNLTNLTYLRLMGNSLNGTIPDSIGNLTKLQTLDLAGNAMNSTYNGYRAEGLGGAVPESVGNLTELKELKLGSYSNFTSLPSSIGNLKKLETLEMSQSRLTSVPIEVKDLTSLKSMNFSYNQINQEIPEEWGQLTNLTNFNVECNAFYGEIPEWTYSVPTIRLSKNHLFDVPAGRGMGTTPTFNYLNVDKIEDPTVKANQYDVTAIADELTLPNGTTTFDVRDNLLSVYQTTKAIYFPKSTLNTESTLVSGDASGISFDGNNVTILKSGTYEINVELKGLQDKTNMNAQATFKVTADLPNQAPVITVAEDHITINQGSSFDYRDYVSVTDDSDTNINEALTVTGTVDVNTPGDYVLTMDATDSEGLAATSKTLYVHVNGIPVITAEDQVITKGDGFDPMADIIVTDEDADIESKVIASGEKMTDSLYYVTYEVTDSNGAKATKTIQVTVLTPANVEPDKIDPSLPVPKNIDPPTNDPKTKIVAKTTPTATKKSNKLPKTGDSTSNHIPLIVGLMALSSAALLLRRK